MFTIRQFLWALVGGLALGAVYTFYIKKILGGFVRKLIELNAFTKSTAVSLTEIGFAKNIFIKFSLREGSSFSETVESFDDKYFIPEANIEKAEKKYSGENLTVIVVLAVIIVLIGIALGATYVFPKLLDMASDIF